MKTWAMHGTFKVVLHWYQQLFTIHVFADGKLVPVVYCLLLLQNSRFFKQIIHYSDITPGS
ncbi:hypothetical protein T07_8889 [Trichinella nelsoni]|uniref:Uncharacterized protein n=1 Tax=Trichinella nelsoni TaxID=6336 RepID=A0A0V0RSG0_9BILA|nr:hypothetical protein T07_8889 [Trichinella nelsoni]